MNGIFKNLRSYITSLAFTKLFPHLSDELLRLDKENKESWNRARREEWWVSEIGGNYVVLTLKEGGDPGKKISQLLKREEGEM